MQSCQSFYAICNRISLRRRAPVLCLRLGSSFPHSVPTLPSVANRFDVPSIKDLFLPLSPPLSLFFLLLSLHIASPFIRAFLLALSRPRFLPVSTRSLRDFSLALCPFVSLSLYRSPPRQEEKCPEIFFVPFLSASRPGASPRAPFPRYRPISASQYSACVIVFPETGVIKPVVYG